MELSKGTTLQGGKYNIERVLGRGSFGITYLANTTIPMDGSRDGLEIETEVAVKEFFMSDLNSRSSNGVNVEQTAAPLVKSYRERFRKEAQTLRNLHHEHIVRVLDVFDENNTTYFVMEYIEGVSVNEYIRSQKHLSEVEAVRIVQEIGAALEYMHNHQMLHLDLKPGNMMRRNDGKAILIDFGLSKVFDDNGKPETSTTIGNGTPPYCPSEQHDYKKSGEIPFTLDVYALGASLYKMLCGEAPPYASEVFDYGLPIEPLQGYGVSKKTISAVMKAMEPRRRNRFQTVGEFLDALPKRLKHPSFPPKEIAPVNEGSKDKIIDEKTVFDPKESFEKIIAEPNISSLNLAKKAITVSFLYLSNGVNYCYEFNEDKVWFTKKTLSSTKQRCYGIEKKDFNSLKNMVSALRLKYDTTISPEDIELNSVYDINSIPQEEQQFHFYEYLQDGSEISFSTIARKGVQIGGNMLNVTPMELDKSINGKLEAFLIEANEIEIGKEDDDTMKYAGYAILWLFIGLLSVAFMIYLSIMSAKSDGWISQQTIICIVGTILIGLFFFFYIGIYAGAFGWLKIIWKKML